jgi:hypothetical protein
MSNTTACGPGFPAVCAGDEPGDHCAGRVLEASEPFHDAAVVRAEFDPGRLARPLKDDQVL